jgi:putative hemolysin
MNNNTPWAVVVVALVVAGGYWYWAAHTAAPQAALANPASVNCVSKLAGTLQIVDTPQGQEGFCHTPDQHFCEEWTLYRGEDCTNFYIATVGHYILLDTGTAPPPRMLSVLDLSLGTTTYTDMYNQPTEVGSSTFSYWRPVATKPTTANCPDLATWTSQGLGAGLERHVTLDLSTLKLSDLGEQRCAARQ